MNKKIQLKYHRYNNKLLEIQENILKTSTKRYIKYKVCKV